MISWSIFDAGVAGLGVGLGVMPDALLGLGEMGAPANVPVPATP